MIRDFMPDQHRELFAMLPLAAGRQPRRRNAGPGLRSWSGRRASSPRPTRAPGDRAAAGYGDPLGASLRAGAPLGLLGIAAADPAAQPHERRRRVPSGGRLRRAVGQSFGNCPQVHPGARAGFWSTPSTASRAVRAEGSRCLRRGDGADRSAPTRSSSPPRPRRARMAAGEGVDVSHRGGRPGFVQVTEAEGRSVLTAPDFAGNNEFNTFGNIAAQSARRHHCCRFRLRRPAVLTGEARWSGTGPRSRASPARSACCASASARACSSRRPCRCAGRRRSSRRSLRGPAHGSSRFSSSAHQSSHIRTEGSTHGVFWPVLAEQART